MLHHIPHIRDARDNLRRCAEATIAILIFPLARRVLKTYIRRGSTVRTVDLMSLVAALAEASYGGLALSYRLDAWLQTERAAHRWRPDDPESVEDLTKHARNELRAWMQDHPDDDPREEGVISEIADSYVPIYNYDRLRVAMESSLWLIAGDVEQSASSVAELLGIAIEEHIADELYEEVERVIVEREYKHLIAERDLEDVPT